METEFAEALSDVAEDEDMEEDTEEEEQPEVNFPENIIGKNGQFYRGTLRSGQKIEVDGSIVVLGDINPGAQIIAGGNVVVSRMPERNRLCRISPGQRRICGVVDDGAYADSDW